ncbi:hypothetical protein B0H13DRAFT_1892017 [Mycena leptocephala]|nr:hypothetical protein B0H13DRAFT_1892017 [Mycena leptocephala]
MDFLPPGIEQIVFLCPEEPYIFDFDTAFAKLGLLTSEGEHLTLSCTYISEGGDIFYSIARHLSRARCVQLRCVSNETAPLKLEYIDAVSLHIWRFTDLRFLVLEFLLSIDSLRVLSREDGEGDISADDRLTVERWGRACPKLRECCFHENAWRLLEDGWTQVTELNQTRHRSLS